MTAAYDVMSVIEADDIIESVPAPPQSGIKTVTVSVDRDRALLRMIGDVDVVEGINNLTAKLPRGGDHTFEVQNDSAEDMEITVNVKIL